MAIRNSSVVATFFADDLFDFNSEQREQFKSAFQSQLEKFREKRKKEILDYIDDSADRIEKKNFSHQDLERLWNYSVNLRRDLLLDSVDDVARLLASLSSKQIEHFSMELSATNQDIKEILEMPEHEQKVFREKKIEKNLKKWIGSLDDNNRQKILDIFAVPRLDLENEFKARVASQEMIVAGLKQRLGDRRRMAEWVTEIAENQYAIYRPEDRFVIEARGVRFKKRTAELLTLLQDRNRQELVVQLKKLAKDLAEI